MLPESAGRRCRDGKGCDLQQRDGLICSTISSSTTTTFHSSLLPHFTFEPVCKLIAGLSPQPQKGVISFLRQKFLFLTASICSILKPLHVLTPLLQHKILLSVISASLPHSSPVPTLSPKLREPLGSADPKCRAAPSWALLLGNSLSPP